jgi:YtkA-like
MRSLLLLVLLLPCPAFAQRVQAALTCKAAGGDFVYDCVIRLTRDGEPLTGAQLSVGADMPSMPMAHNVRPVKAKTGAHPGEYLARLELEMHGEWAVKLRIAGPAREQLVLHYRFTQSGATMSDHRRRP